MVDKNIVLSKDSDVKELAERIGKDIGSLPGLKTNNKNSVVGAINDMYSPQSIATVNELDYSLSNQDKQGSFIESLDDIRNDFFNTNMRDLGISPPAIAECNIDLMDCINDPQRIGYTESTNSTTVILPICKFEAMSANNPFIQAPIRASKIIDASICNFRLVDGLKPLHINLRGSMTVMLRVSKSTDTSPNKEHVTGYYPMKAGEVSVQLENLGDKAQESDVVIQVASTYIGNENGFKVYTNPNVLMFNVNHANLVDTVKSNPSKYLLPAINLNFTQGMFSPFSIQEPLVAHANSVTSDWVLVNDETIWRLIATTSKKLISRRVQMRDHNGVISYDRTNQVTDLNLVGDDFMYLFPEAKYIRVSFSSDVPMTPADITATVAPVGPNADAFYGRWIQFSLNIAKMVTLLPNRDYRFALSLWNKNKNWSGLDSRGIKVLSGSLGFNYDYSHIVKKLVNVKNKNEVN